MLSGPVCGISVIKKQCIPQGIPNIKKEKPSETKFMND
jgi:hypothetical protein